MSERYRAARYTTSDYPPHAYSAWFVYDTVAGEQLMGYANNFVARRFSVAVMTEEEARTRAERRAADLNEAANEPDIFGAGPTELFTRDVVESAIGKRVTLVDDIGRRLAQGRLTFTACDYLVIISKDTLL